MVGLHKDTNEQKAKWNQRKTYESADGKPYKVEGDFGYFLIDGKDTNVFMLLKDVYHLVSITGFADDTFLFSPDINKTGGVVTAQNITDMVNEGRILCAPPKGSVVRLHGLGTFEVANNNEWDISPQEKLKEILELPNRAGNKETVSHRCRRIYHQYLEYPSERTREMLREAYEAVPEHERMYLGDMDSKDSDYVRILYHPNKKRQV